MDLEEVGRVEIGSEVKDGMGLNILRK